MLLLFDYFFYRPYGAYCLFLLILCGVFYTRFPQRLLALHAGAALSAVSFAALIAAPGLAVVDAQLRSAAGDVGLGYARRF